MKLSLQMVTYNGEKGNTILIWIPEGMDIRGSGLAVFPKDVLDRQQPQRVEIAKPQDKTQP